MAATAKICGLSTPAAVAAALTGGAAFVGFVFFRASPRDIDPEPAMRLSQPVRGKAAIVAVTVDPDNALIDQLALRLRPDFIQLHGRETPARALEVSRRSGAGIIKAITVASSSDLAVIDGYESVADYLMFDAKPPSGSALPGGTGNSFDPSILLGHRFKRPWFLAGGLDPWNVQEAIRASGASLVDVSSGVERGPGLKDPTLITSFLEAVRRA